MRLRRGMTIAVGIALLAVAACGGGDSDRLATLRSDPMADYELPGAVDARDTQSAGSTGPGVPSPAKVRRTFTVAEGGVPDALTTLADAARADGWTLHDRAPNGYSGEKTIDDLLAQIVIAGIDADDIVWVEISTRDR